MFLRELPLVPGEHSSERGLTIPEAKLQFTKLQLILSRDVFKTKCSEKLNGESKKSQL